MRETIKFKKISLNMRTKYKYAYLDKAYSVLNIQLEWIGRKRTQAQLGNSISYKAPLMIIVYHSFTNLFIKLVSNRSLTYNDKKRSLYEKTLKRF